MAEKNNFSETLNGQDLVVKYKDKKKELQLAVGAEAKTLENEISSLTNAIIVAYEPFIKSIVNSITPQKSLADDLRQAGYYGMLEALGDYDNESGNAFTTYAYRRIRGEVVDAVNRENHMIRIPDGSFNKAIEKELRGMNLDKVDIDGVLEKAKFPVNDNNRSKVADCISALKSHESFFNEDGSFRELIDTEFSIERAVEKSDICRLVREVLDSDLLNWMEKKVVVLNFGIGCEACSVDEIAKRLDISNKKVYYLRDAAMKKIRNSRFAEGLKAYVA